MNRFPNILLLLMLAGMMTAQSPVLLKNPSFEDNPQYSSTPGGWRNCAFNDESPPDIHPVKGGLFQVTQAPADGDTYLGLVVRTNGSTESVGQQLDTALQKGQCYSVSLRLCKSEKLVSQRRYGGDLIDYDGSVVLRLWGGLSPCGQKSLLAVSPVVDHADWRKYTFQFQPEESIDWISFEAYYAPETGVAYNGNILLDDASPFIPLNCESLHPLVDLDTVEIPAYRYRKIQFPRNSFSRAFYSTYGGGGYLVNMRVVSSPEEVEGLIHDNCGRIGFIYGSAQLTSELGLGLKEVAVNVEQFRDYLLVVGLPEVGKKLTRKRMRNIKKIFREIGLPPRHYRFEPVPVGGPEDGSWLCGHREIWLRLERKE